MLISLYLLTVAVSLKHQASGFLRWADSLSFMQYQATSLVGVSVISSASNGGVGRAFVVFYISVGHGWRFRSSNRTVWGKSSELNQCCVVAGLAVTPDSTGCYMGLQSKDVYK